jgi:NAD(P)-dependent dehydrogenase (short-subunit alcohol dehydrogenase family)
MNWPSFPDVFSLGTPGYNVWGFIQDWKGIKITHKETKTMVERLKGKSAVVTGGGGGIGRAIALAMAEEGAKIIVNDIKAPDGASAADKVVEEIKKGGGAAVANYDSVATMSGGQSIIKTATSNFGRIDILINCAGNYKAGLITDMTENDWDSIIAVHLKGHFSCIQAAVKEMIQQKTGRIINIGSNAAFNFVPGGSRSIAYAAAKAGILGITAALSAHLKQYGITVNGILPGAITQLFPALTRTGAGFGQKKREGPEFVAPLIVYLATDEAQSITGQFFYTAGGDVCIYNRPMQLPGPHMVVRKMGKWTIDELSEVIPSMLVQP